jgi:nucleoside-diphosphate-sugar epimerase
MLQGKPVWIPGAGMTHLQFVHASDLTSAAIQCLGQARPGLAAFNVAHPRTPTIREYLEVLGEVASVRPQIREVPYERLGLDPRSFFPFRDYPCLLDTTKVTKTFDWRPRFDLVEGLEHTFRSLDRRTLLQSDVDVESEQRLLELG